MPEETHAGSSFIYRSPFLYRWIMHRLEGATLFNDLHEAVIALIPPGSSVLELCCGEGILADILQLKNCRYLGFDQSQELVDYGKRKGRNIEQKIILNHVHEFPTVDTTIMLRSLYHFYPYEKELLIQILSHTRSQIIIAEPVVNLANSFGPARWLSRKMTGVLGKEKIFRFTEKNLDERVLSNFRERIGFQRRMGRNVLFTIEGQFKKARNQKTSGPSV